MPNLTFPDLTLSALAVVFGASPVSFAKNQIAPVFHSKVTSSRTKVGGYCADCLQKMNE